MNCSIPSAAKERSNKTTARGTVKFARYVRTGGSGIARAVINVSMERVFLVQNATQMNMHRGRKLVVTER